MKKKFHSAKQVVYFDRAQQLIYPLLAAQWTRKQECGDIPVEFDWLQHRQINNQRHVLYGNTRDAV
jgi:hypothetical protein